MKTQGTYMCSVVYLDLKYSNIKFCKSNSFSPQCYKGNMLKQRHWWLSLMQSMTLHLLQTWEDLSTSLPLQQKMSESLSLFQWGEWLLSVSVIWTHHTHRLDEVTEILLFTSQWTDILHQKWGKWNSNTLFSICQEGEHLYRTNQVWGADCGSVWQP